MSKKIAITGGIGSGKFCVLRKIKELGFSVFSCDEIYKEIIKMPAYIHKITEIFPTVIENGEINRQKLADIVFNDKRELEKLNSIAHPLIMERLYCYMDNDSSNLTFAEVPLLFEGGYENDFDAIIIVVRKEEDRIAAVSLRDNLTEDKVVSRIKMQNALKFSLGKRTDGRVWLIENDKDVKALEDGVKPLIEEIAKAIS